MGPGPVIPRTKWVWRMDMVIFRVLLVSRDLIECPLLIGAVDGQRWVMATGRLLVYQLIELQVTFIQNSIYGQIHHSLNWIPIPSHINLWWCFARWMWLEGWELCHSGAIYNILPSRLMSFWLFQSHPLIFITELHWEIENSNLIKSHPQLFREFLKALKFNKNSKECGLSTQSYLGHLRINWNLNWYFFVEKNSLVNPVLVLNETNYLPWSSHHQGNPCESPNNTSSVCEIDEGGEKKLSLFCAGLHFRS